MPDISLALKFPYIYGGSMEKLVRVTDVQSSPIMEEVNEKVEEEANVRDLGHGIYGYRNVAMAEGEVYEPADLKGKKIRGPNLAVYQQLAKGLGADPTPVAPADITSALKTGTIDGVQLPTSALTAFKLQEILDSLFLTKHYLNHDPFIINLDTWTDLSDDQREIFETSVQRAISEQLQLAEQAKQGAMETLRNGGVKIIGPEQGLKKAKFRKSVTKAFRSR
jgi:TRAP-type C4-dicarboxylate transport system substrate-binding protein